MTKHICPKCGEKLVQMLERDPWDTKLDEGQMDFRNPSKHYGFYCKSCKTMYKQKWEFIVDE